MYKVRSVKISGQGSVILNKMIGHMFLWSGIRKKGFTRMWCIGLLSRYEI